MTLPSTCVLLVTVILACSAPLAGADITTTVLPATITPLEVPPGAPFKITYRFTATAPMAASYTVFVHYRNAKGDVVAQGDHAPRFPTSSPEWLGSISYTVSAKLPADLPDGEYRVVIGMYERAERFPMKPGAGVTDLGGNAFDVGAVTVDRAAPVPKADSEGAKTLDLSGYEITFADEFDGPLDVSAWGPGTKWTAHTPWNGDFGDARFMDPADGFPFTIVKGVLRIEARKDPAFADKDQWKRPWASGLLCSADRTGKGFAQQYGYFEMNAKLPKDPGVWPAFWMASSFDRSKPDAGKDGSVEIDVLEFYGIDPAAYQSAIHIWEPQPHQGWGNSNTTKPGQVADGFHSYGAMVDATHITMYFDGVEMWRTQTPKVYNKPSMVLLNLALGSGWPIDTVPNPCFMEVDYVRVYARKK